MKEKREMKQMKQAVARRAEYQGKWEWNVKAGKNGTGRIIGTACQWKQVPEEKSLQTLVSRMNEAGYEVKVER